MHSVAACIVIGKSGIQKTWNQRSLPYVACTSMPHAMHATPRPRSLQELPARSKDDEHRMPSRLGIGIA